MKRDKLLYLGRFIPYPADSGGKKVSLMTLKILSKEFDLDCIFFKRTKSHGIDDLKTIVNGIRNIILVNFKRFPVYLLPLFNMLGKSYYFYRDIYKKYIKEVYKLISINNYKAVFIDEIFGSLILKNRDIMETLNKKEIKVFMQVHNVESILIERFLSNKPFFFKLFLFFEKNFTRHLECKLLKIPHKTIFISKKDLETAKRICLKPQIDENKYISYFPSSLLQIKPKVDVSKNKNNTILHIGTGHWPPNVEGLKFFLSRVFPIVKRKINNVKFIHIGKKTPKSIKMLHNNKNIFIYDYIKDIESFYYNTDIFVVPLLSGSGIKIKILDAMGYGLPIVTTPIGIEGIPKTEGIIVTKNEFDMAEEIIKLLKYDKYRSLVSCKIYHTAKIIKKIYNEDYLLDIINGDEI